MHGVAHARRLWTAVRQALATQARSHAHLKTWANRLTHWLKKTLQAWHTTMLALRFWFRHSVARASVALKTQLAYPLLTLHPCAHSYLPGLLLHGQLFEIYARQVVREDAHTRANGATGVGQGARLVPPATPPQPSW